MSTLTSVQCEKHALSGLIHNPQSLFQIDNYVKETDFTVNEHQTIYLVLRQAILANEKFDKVLLANKINNLGVKFNGQLNIYDYIDTLYHVKPDKDSVVKTFKELISLRIRRDVLKSLREMAEIIKSESPKSINEILSSCDDIYSSKMKNVLVSSDDNKDVCLFDDVEKELNDQSDNSGNFMMGPFPTINKIYGSLNRPGNITVVGARSGVGKSSLGVYYNMWLAEKYGIPILHCDNGEMTVQELRNRAIVTLTGGQVPLWSIETGKWKQNPDHVKLIKPAIERAKKIKIYYEQVSGLNPKETIRLIRHYSNKLGRNNMFIVNYDYLKGFSSEDQYAPEWKLMGEFIQDIKSFITSEVNIPFWTSIQLNRSGVSTNKKASELNDSESAFGVSDRVLQQSSFSILMRYKVMEEMEAENGLFGNMKLEFLKRRFLGEEFKRAITPVKSFDGKYRSNYINVNHESFFFEDKGDLNDMENALMGKFKNKTVVDKDQGTDII